MIYRVIGFQGVNGSSTIFMNDVRGDQGQRDMQLVEIIREALETGVLTMAAERRLYELLNSRNFNELEVRFVDQMIDALSTGRVQPIA